MRVLKQWQTSKCQINLEWKVADMWLGAFWKNGTQQDVWVCLLPALPIHIIMPEGKRIGPTTLFLLGLAGMFWLQIILVALMVIAVVVR